MLALHCRTRISHALLSCVKDVHVLLCGKNGHLCVSNGILKENPVDRDIDEWYCAVGWFLVFVVGGKAPESSWTNSKGHFVPRNSKERKRGRYMFEIEKIRTKKSSIFFHAFCECVLVVHTLRHLSWELYHHILCTCTTIDGVIHLLRLSLCLLPPSAF